MCMGILPHVCLCSTHIFGAHRGQKRLSDPLQLDGITDGCEPLCTCWDWTWVSWKSRQYTLNSWTIFSAPLIYFYRIKLPYFFSLHPFKGTPFPVPPYPPILKLITFLLLLHIYVHIYILAFDYCYIYIHNAYMFGHWYMHTYNTIQSCLLWNHIHKQLILA